MRAEWEQRWEFEQKRIEAGPGRTPEDRISDAGNLTREQREAIKPYIQREIWMARLVEARRWNEAKDPHIAAVGLQIQICERVIPPHWRIFIDG